MMMWSAAVRRANKPLCVVARRYERASPVVASSSVSRSFSSLLTPSSSSCALRARWSSRDRHIRSSSSSPTPTSSSSSPLLPSRLSSSSSARLFSSSSSPDKSSAHVVDLDELDLSDAEATKREVETFLDADGNMKPQVHKTFSASDALGDMEMSVTFEAVAADDALLATPEWEGLVHTTERLESLRLRGRPRTARGLSMAASEALRMKHKEVVPAADASVPDFDPAFQGEKRTNMFFRDWTLHQREVSQVRKHYSLQYEEAMRSKYIRVKQQLGDRRKARFDRQVDRRMHQYIRTKEVQSAQKGQREEYAKQRLERATRAKEVAAQRSQERRTQLQFLVQERPKHWVEDPLQITEALFADDNEVAPTGFWPSEEAEPPAFMAETEFAIHVDRVTTLDLTEAFYD